MSEEMKISLTTKLAKTDADIASVQRLRYDVFVRELGASGPMADHATQLERDAFDQHAAHLMLLDRNCADGDQVVGTYRLMTNAMAQEAGQFYCESEYDLTPLYRENKRLLELGRSCLHPDYRGGTGMMQLWAGLGEFAQEADIDVLFGVASFHGSDIAKHAAALSMLHHRHLAPASLRVQARGKNARRMDLIAADNLDRVQAVRQLPALIKAYLRLGGTVGQGAYVDHEFNTVDICLILERAAINELRRSIYTKGASRG